MSNINSASRQITGYSRRRHMIAAPPLQPNGGIELTKCIFHLRLIDLLIPNNIHVLSIYLPSHPPPLPPPSSSAPQVVRSPLPSLHPSLGANKMKAFIAEEGCRSRLSTAVSLISRQSLRY